MRPAVASEAEAALLNEAQLDPAARPELEGMAIGGDERGMEQAGEAVEPAAVVQVSVSVNSTFQNSQFCPQR